MQDRRERKKRGIWGAENEGKDRRKGKPKLRDRARGKEEVATKEALNCFRRCVSVSSFPTNKKKKKK